MAFMEPQVTRKMRWLQVNTRNEGIVNYPASDFTAEFVADMHDVESNEVETVEGYGARMSAPGYLDCTEWAVFDSADEAEAYLREYYMDDEEPDNDDSWDPASEDL